MTTSDEQSKDAIDPCKPHSGHNRRIVARLWLAIGFATFVAVVHASGCDRAVAGAVVSDSPRQNPITTNDPEVNDDGPIDLPPCLGIALDIPSQLQDRPFVGSVTFDNECDTGLAILTAPFEVRLSLNREHPFMNETTSTAAYGILYVYPSGMSREELFWPADGGFRTLGPPEYICVPRASQTTVAARAQQGPLIALPIGTYKAFLRTLIAPSNCQANSGEIDLELSVERFNGLHPTETHVYQRSNASLDFSEEVSFRVGPSPRAP